MSTDTQNNAPVSAEPVAQYYCKVTRCSAVEASDEKCICWHDKGTGPHPDAQVGDIYSGVTLTWRRPKPTAPVAAQPAPTQQDATLHAEVLDMVRMLEANEWADHCGKSELGQRLEWAITALQNRPQNIPEIIPESAQQDASKVDAALAKMVHAMFRSANSIPVTRITIDRKQYEAAIDAARKGPA